MSTAERITTEFGWDSTAAEVVEGIDLSGKRVVVTGGASGIGVETARALLAPACRNAPAVRDKQAGAATANDIARTTGTDRATSRRSSSPTSTRCARSRTRGTDRSTCSSTTRA